jgi:hypothetical protein
MNAVYLRGIDSVRIMRRFYCPDLQPFLAAFCLRRQWGRIGHTGIWWPSPTAIELLPPPPCNGKRSARSGGLFP